MFLGKSVSFNGKNKCPNEWARDYKIKSTTLYYRLNVLRWPIGKSLLTPIRCSDIFKCEVRLILNDLLITSVFCDRKKRVQECFSAWSHILEKNTECFVQIYPIPNENAMDKIKLPG